MSVQPELLPEPDDFICFALYSAGHAFGRVYRPLLKALGLTYPQYIAMVALWSHDDRTVSELGDTLFLESNTLTPLLKRLEVMGFLSRSRDPRDERQVRVRLTPTGTALRDKASDFSRCVDGSTGLSRVELRKLRSQVLAMRTSLLANADDE
ncbi:MarR family winged helix-turn-helix transcriptional regulator [Luteibacter aegosomatissinici]|uniref:MarR family winged helix-turn-helix transcriptional regulator n=1 Tax=Luteibacter aegosomatissinici TaxID=2911539 RepID=UPI001FF7067A|nr:MarR family transcriptional regulator [Luteibacter aegosomatissinici]UPG92786.1 MarR family transcriptional regulator [Luteibacter aegosomatissinici]